MASWFRRVREEEDAAAWETFRNLLGHLYPLHRNVELSRSPILPTLRSIPKGLLD